MADTYQLLEDFLRDLPLDVTNIKLSFQNIEQILRENLPPSHINHRQWWENQSDISTRPQAMAWTNAGFKVNSVKQDSIDRIGWVEFERL